MARVITARRADTCTAPECQAPGRAIAAGERINYGGPGAVTHEACPAMDAPRRSISGTSRRTRPGYAYSSSGARLASRYGRCEDAPCCGCCD